MRGGARENSHLLCVLLPEDLHCQLRVRLHQRLLLEGGLKTGSTGVTGTYIEAHKERKT